mmetsp:Transcript_13488/g.19438  ORF Transcript_13488/g.19438 Transcript_13488/m.19438 type:complete len:102 (+) Transcript_13488:37-342(+)
MPEITASTTPDNVPSMDTQSRNQGNRGGRRHNHPRAKRFDGVHDALKGHVYDVTAGKDTFLKTTRKIDEYVSTQYSEVGEFRNRMIDLKLSTLTVTTTGST